jgi:N utilization substance protein A
MEVPEIKAGTVEIKSIAREGGHRSKVAVYARNPNIDPIGACVGMRGSRIQNIVNELAGERIDVIKWDPDPANFVSNALSPAQVLEVEIDVDEHLASVVVPDRMLSLAIGKEGQNARLAAKLTGWRINIASQAAKDRVEAGEPVETLAFEPYAPGETPDIDIILEAEEVAAAADTEVREDIEVPAVAASLEASDSTEAVTAPVDEEDISFASVVDRMAVPRGEDRESEDYGEDEDEEYEIPTTIPPVLTETRPSGIRFGEDLLGRQRAAEEEAAKAAPKKTRRPSRFNEEEEDDMDDIEYSGRIH